MTAKVLESFGGKFAEQWVATLLTPAFVFWLGGFAAGIQRFGWQFFFSSFTQQPEPLQVAILIAGFCGVAASAFIVQRFDLAVLRVLEGYWHPWLHFVRQSCIRKQVERKKKLEQKRQNLRNTENTRKNRFQELKSKVETNLDSLKLEERNEYHRLYEQLLTRKEQEELIQLNQQLREIPQSNNDLMPTRLGNLLRAAERRPLDKYGLDAVICWPRLWLILPDAVKKDLQEARADLNVSARTWLWSLLFCFWTVLAGWTPHFLALWPLLLGLLSAIFTYYYWALDAAKNYGELIEATFDLYRHLLYQSVRWHLPPDPNEERRVGNQLTEYLWRGF